MITFSGPEQPSADRAHNFPTGVFATYAGNVHRISYNYDVRKSANFYPRVIVKRASDAYCLLLIPVAASY